MNETILYISKSEQDIRSFLKYLQSKLKAKQKECTLDEKHDILKVPKYYDIVGKRRLIKRKEFEKYIAESIEI